MGNSLVIFLHSSRYDRVYQAVNLILTASAMGWKCHLFLFFEALASFMAGKWDVVGNGESGEEDSGGMEKARPVTPQSAWLSDLEKNIEAANFPLLYEMLEKAQKEYSVKVCACSTSFRLLNLDPTAVKARVDEIIGLSTMLQIASGAKHVMYI